MSKIGDIVKIGKATYILREFKPGRLNCKPRCALYGQCKSLFGFACDNREPDDEPYYFEHMTN